MLNVMFQSAVELIKAGEKVGASEATLLNMLGISPFTYGLVIEKIYDDGSMLDPEILDITNEQLQASFMQVSGVELWTIIVRFATLQSLSSVSDENIVWLKWRQPLYEFLVSDYLVRERSLPTALSFIFITSYWIRK